VSENELKTEVSTTSVTVAVTVSNPVFAAPSTAFRTTVYVLFAPISVGASKFGALINLSDVEESLVLVNENLDESSPPKIETVADSLVVMVPTEVVFSGTLKDSRDGNVGGVLSTITVEYKVKFI
jgi:hypothetical protein